MCISTNHGFLEKTLNNKHLSLSDFQGNYNFTPEDFINFFYKKTLKERIKLISYSICISSDKNLIYTLFLELTKLIPYIQKNYNLFLIGDAGTGKSFLYSNILGLKSIYTGLPSEALLRGSKTSNSPPLLDLDILMFEEIKDDKLLSNNSQIPLLKNFMSSGFFKEKDETLKKSSCSIISTANIYKEFKDYCFSEFKKGNLFAELPSNLKDEAFLNRFNATLCCYRTLIYKKEYTDTDPCINIAFLKEFLLSLRNIENKTYLKKDENLNERAFQKINDTINGFVKLFYYKSEPDKYFLDFITAWAKHIWSLSNPNADIYFPFDKSCFEFLKYFLVSKDVISAYFLTKNRILFSYADNTSEIFALNGFGIYENEFDLKKAEEYSSFKEIINFEEKNSFILKINQKIVLATSNNLVKRESLTLSNQTDETKNIINQIKYMAFYFNFANNPKLDVIQDFENIKFKIIPDFANIIIKKKAKKIFNINKDLPKTCYFLTNNNEINFINYFTIFKDKE